MTPTPAFRSLVLAALMASLPSSACQTRTSRSASTFTIPEVSPHAIGVINETYDVVIVWLDMGARSRRLGSVGNRGARTFRIRDDVICVDQCRLRSVPVGSSDVLLSPPIQVREGWIPVWRITTNPITSTVELHRAD